MLFGSDTLLEIFFSMIDTLPEDKWDELEILKYLLHFFYHMTICLKAIVRHN